MSGKCELWLLVRKTKRRKRRNIKSNVPPRRPALSPGSHVDIRGNILVEFDVAKPVVRGTCCGNHSHDTVDSNLNNLDWARSRGPSITNVHFSGILVDIKPANSPEEKCGHDATRVLENPSLSRHTRILLRCKVDVA